MSKNKKRKKPAGTHTTVIIREQGRFMGGAEAPDPAEALRLAQAMARLRPEAKRFRGHSIAEGLRTETGAVITMRCGAEITVTTEELTHRTPPSPAEMRLDCKACAAFEPA